MQNFSNFIEFHRNQQKSALILIDFVIFNTDFYKIYPNLTKSIRISIKSDGDDEIQKPLQKSLCHAFSSMGCDFFNLPKYTPPPIGQKLNAKRSTLIFHKIFVIIIIEKEIKQFLFRIK